MENCAHSTYQCLFSLVPFFADSLHLIFVHIYARVLKCEGVLISEFKHMSLNARKYGKYNHIELLTNNGARVLHCGLLNFVHWLSHIEVKL